jgi:mannose-6-phosphate isomerase-like protein (cupin superfamily)
MKNAKVLKLDSSGKYQRLFSKDSGASCIKSGHVRLQAGEAVGDHSTEQREEMLVILKGMGEAVIDGTNIVKIDDNSVVYIPPCTRHDIRNTGKDILEYIFITCPV